MKISEYELARMKRLNQVDIKLDIIHKASNASLKVTLSRIALLDLMRAYQGMKMTDEVEMIDLMIKDLDRQAEALENMITMNTR